MNKNKNKFQMMLTQLYDYPILQQNPYMTMSLRDIAGGIGNGFNNMMGNLNGLGRYLQGQPGYNNNMFRQAPYYFDYN